ncbi:lytic transglycosylase [Microvirga sp. KLBC 81]|uniref:lytic transglycosylase domain-containing protein n=1 Tax=Microvirga sp. KLBC 81 TaxID=1862707 RepID=UPI000D514373|nr:lytic transglycosylase domain-containing protein [Microvirga sp. KLBC 81]PVE24049.1 lytic transglycosylase [Microvirga sp. KLBC 81]
MIARFVLGCAVIACVQPALASDRVATDALVAQHAKAHGIPETLVHRVIKRESGYNARAKNRIYWGLMQIRHDTARGMGYTGPASGLLDANTNLTYAVPYLANAYRVAGGNHDRAVALYAGGYYYEAKRKGMLRQLRTAMSGPVSTAATEPASTGSITGYSSLRFSPKATSYMTAADR